MNGAVTAGHPLAAEAGLEVLRDGGNAMDAAITMAGVLAVARPHMNGVGGDMFLLYYDAESDAVYGLNASGRAGTAKSFDEIREGRWRMPPDGALSVSVPGAVGGWAAALERFGTITWQEALRPAVELAESGLPVSERISRDIAVEAQKLQGDPESSRIFLPNGTAPRPGTRLMMPELASTLERIRVNGPEEIYTGEIAGRIAAYLQERGGTITAEDLAAYEPFWVEPISTPYRGVEVMTLPPNTQGVALLEELTILSHFDLAALGHNSPDYLHLLTETIRSSFEDLLSEVGDPDHMSMSVGEMLALDRLAARAGAIEVPGVAMAMPASAAEDHPNTVYLIAVDDEGNVVSMIQSLFASFGSGLTVTDTGIVLQNRGALFRLEESHPNAFGPGRRPFHTLMPVLAMREGKPWLAFGTPGGFGQTQTHIQVLNNILVFGMTPQEAIDAPRMVRMLNGTVMLENRIHMSAPAALRERGYTVGLRGEPTDLFGGAQAIMIDEESGALRAGADRRREGFALAY